VGDVSEPIGQDCAVQLTRRSLAATSVIGLLLAATGFATWLGLSQSPAAPSGLAGYIADSQAEGTVGFVMTLRTEGFGTSLQRVRGEIDFADGEGREISETVTPHALPQYTETVVVHGAAYERPAVDRSDGPHFGGPWQPLSTGMSVPPFAPLVGLVGPMAVPPHLVRLSEAAIGGVPVTEYQVASFGASCPPGAGPATQLDETTWLWVDGQGRILRWENRAAEHIGDATAALHATIVVSFGDFGAPVSVAKPTNVLGVATRTATPVNPFAGCLVTPG
jgi:hypothetical protein